MIDFLMAVTVSVKKEEAFIFERERYEANIRI